MSAPYTLTASILSANFSILQAEVDTVAQCDALQIDVMDGHFVPNLSFGAPVIRQLQTNLPLDVHLMVKNPEERIEEFLALGAQTITFHYEALDFPDTIFALVAAIRDGGANAGIALNPKTKIENILPLLPAIDSVTVMTVEPGFGGQSFMQDQLDKVRTIRREYRDLSIQVDGGVSLQTLPECIAAGANNFVMGSALFSAQNREEYISQCRTVYA